MYKQRIKLVIELLKELVDDNIKFQVFKIEDLLLFGEITGCSSKCDNGISEQKYCMKSNESGESTESTESSESGKCVLLIPNKHLISDMDNESIYYGRVADELIRYRRIRLFMFQSNYYLNISDSEYKLNVNELIILQSLIGSDYFKNLVPFNASQYIKNINYELADPSISQTYSREIVLQEQNQMISVAPDLQEYYKEFAVECVVKRDKVIGNIQNSMWKRIFPKTTEEIMFKVTIPCSYYPIIMILQEKLKAAISIQNVKAFLWKGYRGLMDEFGPKIISILKSQGKRNMMERVSSKKVTFERLIFSEEYYITDLDLWVLAKDAQIPLVLFSSTKLKQLSLTNDWILLGGNVESFTRVTDSKSATFDSQSKLVTDSHIRLPSNGNLYFIRTPAQIIIDTPPEYHLISPSYPLSELKEFREIMEEAINESSKPDHSNQNIQTLESYLRKTAFILKKKV
jgi:hypothetical protein